VVLNPFLRMVGWQIGSVFENNKLKKIVICRCEKIKYMSFWEYDMSGKTLEKRRMFV
jgi:hypothetical protein